MIRQKEELNLPKTSSTPQKNENTYQNVLQAVEHHRKQNPNQRKKNKN